MTGAGSGIGRATARALAARGADLVLCDIEKPGLESLEHELREMGRRTLVHEVDVSQRSSMEAFAERVHGEIEAVDILVNNAGVAVMADFLDCPLQDWDWIVGVNLWGVIHGLHFFVPRMVERGKGGHVVNVSSVAGFLAARTLIAYSATKFGVFAISEALRPELAPHGIGVSVICPGFIDTPISERARFRGVASDEEIRQRTTESVRRFSSPPELVARKILSAIQRNRAVVPVTSGAWLLYYLKRATPRAVLWTFERVVRLSRRRETL